MPISILLVDDNKEFLEFLRELLREKTKLTVLGEAANGDDAVRLAKELRPDVVLMDIVMPALNGLKAAERIKSDRPEARVIMMTIHKDDAYRTAAMESGADAFLRKQTLLETLPPTVRDLMREHAA